MAVTDKSDSGAGPVLSADDVRRLAGPLDDETVAQILTMGATYDELEVAAGYAAGDGDRYDREGHELTGRIAEIYEILRADEEEPE
jgi:hypothetical protein